MLFAKTLLHSRRELRRGLNHSVIPDEGILSRVIVHIEIYRYQLTSVMWLFSGGWISHSGLLKYFGSVSADFDEVAL